VKSSILLTELNQPRLFQKMAGRVKAVEQHCLRVLLQQAYTTF